MWDFFKYIILFSLIGVSCLYYVIKLAVKNAINESILLQKSKK